MRRKLETPEAEGKFISDRELDKSLSNVLTQRKRTVDFGSTSGATRVAEAPALTAHLN